MVLRITRTFHLCCSKHSTWHFALGAINRHQTRSRRVYVAHRFGGSSKGTNGLSKSKIAPSSPNFWMLLDCWSSTPCMPLTHICCQCINSIRRLRDPPDLFDAEKYSASAAQHAASANSGSPLGRASELTFSDLSPLIYHETECNLSSQVFTKPYFDSNRQRSRPPLADSYFATVHSSISSHEASCLIQRVRLRALKWCITAIFNDICLFCSYHVSCWNTKKKQASKGTLQLIGRHGVWTSLFLFICNRRWTGGFIRCWILLPKITGKMFLTSTKD